MRRQRAAEAELGALGPGEGAGAGRGRAAGGDHLERRGPRHDAGRLPWWPDRLPSPSFHPPPLPCPGPFMLLREMLLPTASH